MLLALAIRILKSVATIVFPLTPDFVISLGLVGLTAIGPFLLLHINALKEQRLNRLQYAHLMPAFLILLATPFLEEPYLYYIYLASTTHLIFYLLIAIRYKQRLSTDAPNSNNYQRWTTKLTTAIGVISALFVIQIAFDIYLTYFLATVVATIVLYGLSLYAFKHNDVFNGKRRLTKKGDLESIVALIENVFANQKIYRTSELTINKLGNHLGIKPYLVSQAINEGFEKSLPELVTTYRLAEIKDKLESPDLNHFSIEAIASDAGFNSLSSFYTAFKKTYASTPAEYRKRFIGKRKTSQN